MTASPEIQTSESPTVSPPKTDIELGPLPSTPKSNDASQPSLIVTFAEPHDVENPMQWPDRQKWAVTNVLSATGFNRIMVSTIMAPALHLIAADLDMNPTEAAMSLSIYLLATAVGPLVIGPLSEMYGRRIVLHTSNVWFLIWNIVCGFATTKGTLIAARLFAGLGASSIYALAGGVLTDVWSPEQRGKSLGVYLAFPLVAVAVGPIIGGFMTSRANWRWMFWSTSIFQALMVVFCCTTFNESYAPTILKRRAAKLRRETGRNYQTVLERSHQQRSVLAVLGINLSRPLRLLACNPVIQISSLISAFNYGILYIVLSSFAELYSIHYGQSVEISGLHYIACALGEIIGSQVGGPLMDVLYRRMVARAPDGEHQPEFRLPLSIPAAAIAPLGLFAYGWTAEKLVHWASVDAGIFVFMFALQIASMPMQAYVMDAYPDHTSSALSASQFPRSLAAFLFPLFAPSMYSALGYGWGNTTIAFVGLVLGILSPALLWVLGPRLRMRHRWV
ncbi:major facilitator superfamily domain-containing protein [Plectosphaerella plurivora]|uniref:Major facilitator superfamily domain-containing protein n=1 Tax=Plectosphaerella plurivora TaxID=936078 RepID=A0A9P8VIW9_9PEZI|nr:major facilitator superfamily domain-containing protein [Plectosphaerella plurivora]